MNHSLLCSQYFHMAMFTHSATENALKFNLIFSIHVLGCQNLQHTGYEDLLQPCIVSTDLLIMLKILTIMLCCTAAQVFALELNIYLFKLNILFLSFHALLSSNLHCMGSYTGFKHSCIKKRVQLVKSHPLESSVRLKSSSRDFCYIKERVQLG